MSKETGTIIILLLFGVIAILGALANSFFIYGVGMISVGMLLGILGTKKEIQ